jgi:hypothetical protein
MPIQNVGTLIENLVITESAAVLLEHVPVDQKLGFATAFAMPLLSEWRPHNQAVGMSATALEQIRNGPGGTDFLDVMKACLRHSLHRGPSGALLVGLLAALKRRGLRVWANDIEDGHYGNAIPRRPQPLPVRRRPESDGGLERGPGRVRVRQAEVRGRNPEGRSGTALGRYRPRRVSRVSRAGPHGRRMLPRVRRP